MLHICVQLGCSRFRVRVDGLHEMVQYGLCTLARAATRLVGENLHTPFFFFFRWVGGWFRHTGLWGRVNRFNRYNEIIVQFRSPTEIYESVMKTPRALSRYAPSDRHKARRRGATLHPSLQWIWLIIRLITDSPCCHRATPEPGHPSLSLPFHFGTCVIRFVWNNPLKVNEFTRFFVRRFLLGLDIYFLS